MLDGFNPNQYSDEQLWCLGLSAVNTQYNGERHDLLGHSDRDQYQNILSAWWDIVDRDTYQESIEWLRDDGHRSDFNEVLGHVLSLSSAELHDLLSQMKEQDARTWHRFRIVSHYRTVIHRHGIVAWDLARVVLLARMAFTAGYINEFEAWETIYEEATQANTLFDNWYEFSQSYLIGRQFAMRNLDDAAGNKHIQSAHALLSDPGSPWVRFPKFGHFDIEQFNKKNVH